MSTAAAEPVSPASDVVTAVEGLTERASGVTVTHVTADGTLGGDGTAVLTVEEEAAIGRADAVVVVNLVQDGSPDQQSANRQYGASMLGAMAEGGYGPLHMGAAVRVERDYDFDSVAIVYYPGVDFFADMATSDFFQGIVGDKQLADTQAVLTVPVLDRL